MKKTNEPFFWGLFSAGGMIAAFVVPVLILLTGFVAPLGMAGDGMAYDSVRALVSNVLVKVALAGAVTLTLFHCMHRIRHTLVDVGLTSSDGVAAALCYLAATAGGVWCGTLLGAL